METNEKPCAEQDCHSHDHVHEFHHHHAPGEPEHVHTYHHSHDHEHDGEHVHTHEQEQGAEALDMSKVEALMEYMAGHNAEHTKELADIAGELKRFGFSDAYDKTMKAVSLFTEGTAVLSEALAELKK